MYKTKYVLRFVHLPEPTTVHESQHWDGPHLGLSKIPWRMAFHAILQFPAHATCWCTTFSDSVSCHIYKVGWKLLQGLGGGSTSTCSWSTCCWCKLLRFFPTKVGISSSPIVDRLLLHSWGRMTLCHNRISLG